jgi:hypothetical protein
MRKFVKEKRRQFVVALLNTVRVEACPKGKCYFIGSAGNWSRGMRVVESCGATKAGSEVAALHSVEGPI